MRRSGFTVAELLIALVIVSTVTAASLPRLFTAIYKLNVRSARVAFANLAVKARAAAAQRGCVATLNFTTGAAGVVWVTACKINQAGTDTLGGVEPLAARFGVSTSSTNSSLQYEPHGFSVGSQPVTVVFTATGGGGQVKDSAMVNQVGKVIR